MVMHHEALCEHGALGQIHRADVQCEDPATALAGEMVVMALAGLLVQGFTVYRNGLNLLLVGQQLEGPVHRGYSQARQRLLRASVDVYGAQRPFGFLNNLSNHFSLAGGTRGHTAQANRPLTGKMQQAPDSAHLLSPLEACKPSSPAAPGRCIGQALRGKIGHLLMM